MSGGTRSYEMVRRLVALGHEVHVVTSDRDPRDRARGEWCTTEEDGILVPLAHRAILQQDGFLIAACSVCQVCVGGMSTDSVR